MPTSPTAGPTAAPSTPGTLHGPRRTHRPWLVLALGILVYLVAQFVAFIGLVTVSPGDASTAALILVMAAVATAIALGGYWWIVRGVEKRPCAELALTGPEGRHGRRDLPAGLAVGALLMAATVGILAAAGSYNAAAPTWSLGIVTGIAAAIVAGVSEELLFRGIIQRLLAGPFGVWWALTATAALFGLLHVANPGATLVGAIAIIVEAGILLGSAFLLTGRLWLAIGIHIGWNATQSSLFGIPVSGIRIGEGLLPGSLYGPNWLSGGSMGAEGSLIAILLAGAAGAALLAVAWRRRVTVSETAPETMPETMQGGAERPGPGYGE